MSGAARTEKLADAVCITACPRGNEVTFSFTHCSGEISLLTLNPKPLTSFHSFCHSLRKEPSSLALYDL